MESPPYLPTGTVTFLFTDIKGSTKLAQEYPHTWEVLRNHHNTILRSAIEFNSPDGEVVMIALFQDIKAMEVFLKKNCI